MVRKPLIVILLALLCASSPLAADGLEQWWIGRQITGFEFVDASGVSPDVLRNLTDPYVGKPYDEQEMDQLEKDLLQTGKFVSADFFPSRTDEEGVYIYIEFVESKTVQAFVFSGNKQATAAELASSLAVRTGDVFDAAKLSAAVESIKTLYKTKGFDQVDVSWSQRVDAKTGNIIVSFLLKEYDWWINKPIREFTYSGLKNVDREIIDDITFSYLDKPFTKDLYTQIEAKLNALLVFSVFRAEAVRGGKSTNDLVIAFEFTELPMIESIVFSGNNGIRAKALEEAVPLKVGDFLSISQVNAGVEAVRNVYIEKGFAEVDVKSSYTIDEETNKLVLTLSVTENRQVKIGEIAFEGNVRIPQSELLREVSSKVQSLFNAGNYSATKISADAQAIQLAYQKRGFIDASIQDVRLEELSTIEDPVKRVRIIFVISEGEQWFFGSLKSVGNNVYSNEEMAALVTLKSGDVLDIQKVQENIGNIADLYWNEGYVENTLDITEQRDTTTRTIHYTLNITERGQAVVEQVLVRGLTKTKPYVMDRELVLKPGDVFSKEKYIRSAQNLYNTGLLTDIKPDIVYGSEENSLVVTYDVVEGNQMNIGFGATFGGNVDGFPVSGFLQWSDTNLWGTGKDLSISTELAPDSQTASISFSDDWIGNERWGYSFSFSFEHSSRTNGLILGNLSPDTSSSDNQAYPYPYTSYAQWESADFATPDAEYLMPYEYYQLSATLSTGYTWMFDAGRLTLGGGPTFTLNRAIFDQTLYTPYDYLISQYGEQWQLSNRIGITASWDGRDYIQNTTKGYIAKQSFIYSGGLLGGLSNYMRSSTSLSGYLKVFEFPGEKPVPVVASLTSSVSLMLDQFYPSSGVWDWNIRASKYEYLYIDGMTVGRGFSPVFYQRFMWDTSADLSVQLVENLLWGELFASATGVSKQIPTPSQPGVSWYFAAGAGIKLKIPGFPLGLYLVKNATLLDGEDFSWIGGSVFKGAAEDSGLKLVLAITTSLF